MCTVTFLPKDNNNFILTSNRDEAPGRAANQFARLKPLNNQILFPQDPQAGGTWVCSADNDRLVCLLNGAFERHNRQTPYRRSRGLVVLDVFDYASASDFSAQYNLDNIEPFTMVMWDKGNLFELVWDATQQHFTQLSAEQAYIWSSAPLYNAKFRAVRKTLFQTWLQQYSNKEYTAKDALAFHQSKGTGDPMNDFVMNRYNFIKTVSITSIEKQTQQFVWQHKDLLNEHLLTDNLHIKS